ncbi:uncharacterized protein [Coffea arabica]|uniref:Uncharacterized protein isoform X1 n=1 Tax=Coffea arabica TaxID=13443 RepID=A0ABM4W702_COFAR
MAAVKGPDTMGNHVRRFIVWTKSAFEKLDEIYRQMTMNSSFPWLMVISRSLKENGLSNLVVLTPTHLAIVMEYAAGGELFAKICSAGGFNEDEIADVWSIGVTLYVMLVGAYHIHLIGFLFIQCY